MAPYLGAASGATASAATLLTARTAGLTQRYAAAAPGRRPLRPPVVRPRFRRVTGGGLLWAGARYVVTGGWAPSGYYDTVIDDQTGQVRTIRQPGCTPGLPTVDEPLSLPWLVIDCAPQGFVPGVGFASPEPELYSPLTGHREKLTPSPGVSNACPYGDCPFYRAVGAGTAWLQYDESTCQGGAHCSDSSVFQNIATGELRPDPSAGTTTVDLNAPGLTRTVCPPLTVPTALEIYREGTVPGSLIFHGSFAVAIGNDYTSSTAYLERCGTPLHRPLTRVAFPAAPVVAANAHEVVWLASGSQPYLSALTLPALRPFRIALPVGTCGGDMSASGSSLRSDGAARYRDRGRSRVAGAGAGQEQAAMQQTDETAAPSRGASTSPTSSTPPHPRASRAAGRLRFACQEGRDVSGRREAWWHDDPILFDAAGRRRSPATMPGHHRGVPSRSAHHRGDHRGHAPRRRGAC